MNFLLKPFAFVIDGGPVALILVMLSLVLWYAIGFRYLWLKSLSPVYRLNQYLNGSKELNGGQLFERWVDSILKIPKECNDYQLAMDTCASHFRVKFNRNQQTIRSIVIVAPLLGLLGTVIGMIETFDSLQDAALFSQSGGIAGGISQALITTQLGLVVAIPGLLIGRKLDRMQKNISESVDFVLLNLQIKNKDVC